MQRSVAYVRADMTLLELAAFLEEEEIHGAPVVDAASNLVGVVSRTDLVRAVTEGEEEEPHRGWFRMLNDEGDYTDGLTDIDSGDFPGSDRTVAEIMSTDVVTVPPSASAAKVAELMIQDSVHRVLVVENGKVAGILSATDLLRAVVEYEPRH
jgi:CBS domain-containing protein